MNIMRALLAAVIIGLGAIASAPANAQEGKPFLAKKSPTVAPKVHHGGPKVAQPQHGGGHGGGHKPHHRSHTGRNVAAGVAAGVIGAIILNEAAKANSDREVVSEERGPRHSCRSLSRRCDDGQDWACRKFDRQCN